MCRTQFKVEVSKCYKILGCAKVGVTGLVYKMCRQGDSLSIFVVVNWEFIQAEKYCGLLQSVSAEIEQSVDVNW